MAERTCTHGSIARSVLHVHWCPRCSEWRFYRFYADFGMSLRGGIPKWSDNILLELGTIPTEATPSDDVVTHLMGRILTDAQHYDLEARETWRRNNAHTLLRRLETGRG